MLAMSDDQRITTTGNNREVDDAVDVIEVREIHALTSPPAASNRPRRRESWETGSQRPSTPSAASDVASENFSTMSREFNAMVLAGSTLQGSSSGGDAGANLGRIGEDLEETNPLAIVPDTSHLYDPVSSPRRVNLPSGGADINVVEEVSLPMVKKEEVESKIVAWQTAKIAKINNRFKREDVIINGWESEQVEKAASLYKKVERKLDEKRARAIEKMQNDVAKAHRKAEEKRASSEGKRGMKVARVLELVNLMKAVGKAPSKRSYF